MEEKKNKKIKEGGQATPSCLNPAPSNLPTYNDLSPIGDLRSAIESLVNSTYINRNTTPPYGQPTAYNIYYCRIGRLFTLADYVTYVNTVIFNDGIDYRCIVRDDSRLCPMDVKKYLVIHNKQITDSMATSEDDYQSDTEKPVVGINTSTHTILDSIKNELKDYIFY